jgi:hypothetical protein
MPHRDEQRCPVLASGELILYQLGCEGMPLIAKAQESLEDPSSTGYRRYNLINRGQSTWPKPDAAADDVQRMDSCRSYLQYNTKLTFQGAGFRKSALTHCGRYGYIIVGASSGWVMQPHRAACMHAMVCLGGTAHACTMPWASPND